MSVRRGPFGDGFDVGIGATMDVDEDPPETVPRKAPVGVGLGA